VLGQVLAVGGSAAGALPRMGLDQLAAVEHLDQGGVGPHVDGLSNVVTWNRVDCPPDLDVEVAVDLAGAKDRHVIRQ
jgi:hypothetical protein